MRPFVLEVCAETVESARAALCGGAKRIELCSALSEGGLTPSYAAIQRARSLEGLVLHVLIRPRGGDFIYDDEEVETMAEDIRVIRELGADGIVIGCLTPDGDINIKQCNRLMKEASEMNVTFHRAFDQCRDPFKTLDEIVSIGCNRLLTSGQAPTAEQGVTLIRQLVERADDRLTILPGSGVNPSNAKFIIEATGVHELHASARSSFPSSMKFHLDGVTMGASDNSLVRMETDPCKVRAILDAVK